MRLWVSGGKGWAGRMGWGPQKAQGAQPQVDAGSPQLTRALCSPGAHLQEDTSIPNAIRVRAVMRSQVRQAHDKEGPCWRRE